MPAVVRALLPLWIALVLAAPPSGAQSVPIDRLDEPDARIAEPFTTINGLRELSDGRLLVSDGTERLVRLVDPTAGTVSVVGRQGSGPGEYDWPNALYAAGGDSTLLLDLRGRRLLLLGPDGQPTGDERRLGMIGGGFRAPRAMDRAGRLYLDLAGILATGIEGGALRGRIGLLRLDPRAGRPDTVAELNVPPMAPPQGAGVRPMPPYRAADTWDADRDGRVAVVRHDPYRVEWFEPDGEHRVGPVVPYEPVPVGRAEREAYLDRLAGGPGMVVTQGGERRTVRPPRPAADALDWPDVLPPFAGPAWITADRRVWVRRSRPASTARPLYDVFDRDGRLVRQVEFPAGRRVVAMGRGTVYAAFTDEVGLSWLERYRR